MAALVVGTTYSITGTPNSATTYQTAGIDYMVVSQNTDNNTSLIRIRPWIMKSGGTGAYSYTDRTMTIYAVSSAVQQQTVHDYDQEGTTNNVKYYLTGSIPFRRVSGSYEPFEFTVAHSADGTYAALPLYAYIDLQNSGTGRIWTVNTTVELPTINRQSTLSQIADFGIDDTITLGITKYVAGYTDKLKIEIGATEIRAEATVVDTDEVTFTAGEKTDIEAEMTGPEIEMTFTLTSYNGATPIGTSVVTATCSSLNQSILRSWVKTATGYQMAVNGLVDQAKADGLQVFGKLYVGDNEIVQGQCAMRAYMSGTVSNISDGGYTIVPLNTESYDIGGNFNTSTYKFTAPANGYYLISYCIEFSGVVADKRYCARLTSGASTVMSYNNVHASLASYVSLTRTDTYYVTAGTEISLYVNATGTSAADFGGEQNSMSITRIA